MKQSVLLTIFLCGTFAPFALNGAAIAQTTGVSPAAATMNLAPLPELPPRPIKEDPFCTIAGVDRTANRVIIYFTQRQKVRVTGLENGYNYEDVFDPAHVNSKFANDIAPTLYLSVGDQFELLDIAGTPGGNPDRILTTSSEPGDSNSERCSGKVVQNADGSIRLEMLHETFDSGNLVTREKTLIAQPDDAIIRQSHSDIYDFYFAWPKALSDIPALNRDIENEVNEAEARMIDYAKTDAEARADGSSVNPLSAYTTIIVAGSNDNFLSLLAEGYEYTGGAHGMSGYRARLWDKKKKTEIKDISTIFADAMQSLHAPYNAALDAQRVIKSGGDWHPVPGGKYLDNWDYPEFENLAIVFVGESGQPFDRIRFIAGPYMAGPYSDGIYDISFPITAEVMAAIKPEYVSSFMLYQAK